MVAQDLERFSDVAGEEVDVGELSPVGAAAFEGVIGAFEAGSYTPSVQFEWKDVIGYEFTGMAEVLFAVLYAWLLLGQMPSPAELTGGALMLTGVILIRADDTRRSALT